MFFIYIFSSEQTFMERLVKLSRFMNIDVHRALIEGIKNEKLLRLRLNELKYYKKIGLTKLSDINKFNVLQKHRRQKDKEISKKIVNFYFPK